jgi:hypothetical protein
MRIRKFNESLNEIDLEYVEECFIDIIDMGFQVSVDYMDYYDDNNDLRTGYDTCEVNIEKLIKQKYVSEAVSIEHLTNTFDKISEMINCLEVSIEKVKSKYDVSSVIFFRQNNTSINIEFKKD